MKALGGLDPAFEHRARLAIAVLLEVRFHLALLRGQLLDLELDRLQRVDLVLELGVLRLQRQRLELRLDARVLGLQLLSLSRADLRVRPKTATITEGEIETILTRRKEARAAKDFATSDKLRDELIAAGVEVMDGDPLGWDWRLGD